MIRETLTAVYGAGRQALQGIAPQGKTRTQITQVREWSFAMPQLARVTVANSPVHQIYVGLSSPLARYLEERAEREPAGFQALVENFKSALVARVPAKRPIGTYEILPPNGEPQVLRGVRSFILRQQTAVGNLYLMADVTSRAEYESIKLPQWEEELALRLLPRDIARLDTIDQPVAIGRLATYLSRCEHDLELLIPGEDDHVHASNAVVVKRDKNQDREILLLSLDLDRDLRSALRPGLELEGSFGAAGRVLRFRTICAGEEPLMLEQGAALPCFQFEMPRRFSLDQRRRYFRVRPGDELEAYFEVLPASAACDEGEDPLAKAPAPPAEAPAGAVRARVDDLSFSGAGLVTDEVCGAGLQRDGLIHVWIKGRELRQPMVLTGLVRRLSTAPRGRGRSETSIGLEFVVRGPSDRQGTQAVRQYVMARQRAMLAERSAVPQAV